MADIVVPKHTRLTLVLLVPVLWPILAFGFAHAEHAQRVSNVKPMHSLILAVFPLVVMLPVTFKRLSAMRLFRLYMAIWGGVTIPAVFFLFTWVAEYRSNSCDYLAYGSGLFMMATLGVDWCIESVKTRRRLRIRSKDGMAQANERAVREDPADS